MNSLLNIGKKMKRKLYLLRRIATLPVIDGLSETLESTKLAFSQVKSKTICSKPSAQFVMRGLRNS